jgi:hypothetical protein
MDRQPAKLSTARRKQTDQHDTKKEETASDDPPKYREQVKPNFPVTY